MEVRPGYKQTEVGVIPEDWDCVAVQVLVDENILKKPLDGNHGNIHPKSNDFVDYGIPFVMANNFMDGHVDLLGCKFITKERAAKLQKGFSIAGDVLLTHKGTVGSTAIVPKLSVDFIMLTPQVTYYRVKDETRLNNGFLRQYFDSQPFQSLFKSLAGGGTRAYLGIVKQLALPIIKPPIDEQWAIAAALSDVDALLSGLHRLIAKKRDLKKAAMQQLLTGQIRLPGFHGEWEVASLDMLASRVTGVWGKNESDERNSRLAEIIRAGDISQDGRLTSTANRYVAPEEFEKAKCVLDDLVITTSGNGLGKLWWCDGRSNIAASNFVRVLHPEATTVVGKFLYYALRTGEGLRQLQEHTATSAYPNLRPTYFSTAWIPLPAPSEQTAIAAVLWDMDAELAALEARRDKTSDLKQAMMHELLTGKTRLV